jgi:predicted aconitase with swiveling domain
MKKLYGHGLVGGYGMGTALVTRMPMNFPAAFSKPINLLPSRRAEVRDHHHDLLKKNVKGTVLVLPACIGSSYSGMVLLQLMYEGQAPAAIVVQHADSLLISGSVLAEVWFNRGIPVVEYNSEDLFQKIHTGDKVKADGDTGEINIY